SIFFFNYGNFSGNNRRLRKRLDLLLRKKQEKRQKRKLDLKLKKRPAKLLKKRKRLRKIMEWTAVMMTTTLMIFHQ
ncbi:MAG: hypothetical protein KBT11_03250, partial [Treponema sp.]|nr:hypothetical protein [Candidatus Treponema equifaecale]